MYTIPIKLVYKNTPHVKILKKKSDVVKVDELLDSC